MGSIIDMIMSTGERKNLRISRSTMANILFMAVLPAAAASETPPSPAHREAGGRCSGQTRRRARCSAR